VGVGEKKEEEGYPIRCIIKNRGGQKRGEGDKTKRRKEKKKEKGGGGERKKPKQKITKAL